MRSLTHIPRSLIKGWIALLNHPFTECDVSDDQRELLADLFAAYQAFVWRAPNVQRSAFRGLAEMLIKAAFDLDPLEAADEHLRGVVSWLHAHLPEVCRLSIRRHSIHYSTPYLGHLSPSWRSARDPDHLSRPRQHRALSRHSSPHP